jgi:uncharacterized protein (DUF2384 family)
MQTEATINSPKPARAAYTLSEFAALFGREQTWAYRMKYRGKIKVLPSEEFLHGGDMVPHSEVERLLSKATNTRTRQQANGFRKDDSRKPARVLAPEGPAKNLRRACGTSRRSLGQRIIRRKTLQISRADRAAEFAVSFSFARGVFQKCF